MHGEALVIQVAVGGCVSPDSSALVHTLPSLRPAVAPLLISGTVQRRVAEIQVRRLIRRVPLDFVREFWSLWAWGARDWTASLGLRFLQDLADDGGWNGV